MMKNKNKLGDVNKDGIVDEKDLSIVHKDYHKDKERRKKDEQKIEPKDETYIERLRRNAKKGKAPKRKK